MECMLKEKAITCCRWGGNGLGWGTAYGQYTFHGLHILQGASRICEARQVVEQEGTNKTRQLLRQDRLAGRADAQGQPIRDSSDLLCKAARPSTTAGLLRVTETQH